jgi:hypothetical protein
LTDQLFLAFLLESVQALCSVFCLTMQGLITHPPDYIKQHPQARKAADGWMKNLN